MGSSGSPKHQARKLLVPPIAPISPRLKASMVRQPKVLHSSSAPTAVPYSLRRQILQRYAEHFRGVFNRPSTILNAAITRLPQVETNVDLDLPPSLHETIWAVLQPTSENAPGSDAISVEIYKHGGPQLMDPLTAPFQEKGRQEVLQDFKAPIHISLLLMSRANELTSPGDLATTVSADYIAGDMTFGFTLKKFSDGQACQRIC
ncbi:hypothetical protein SprV_0902797500 [Sparganum proliferum]